MHGIGLCHPWVHRTTLVLFNKHYMVLSRCPARYQLLRKHDLISSSSSLWGTCYYYLHLYVKDEETKMWGYWKTCPRSQLVSDRARSWSQGVWLWSPCLILKPWCLLGSNFRLLWHVMIYFQPLTPWTEAAYGLISLICVEQLSMIFFEPFPQHH